MADVLTEADYRNINKGLNSLARGMRLIELAEQSGENMDEYRATFDRIKERLEGKKRVFFPERP